ncbi:hypothetical protein [Nocardia sp. MH4]|uniref:hypothetical protein n=1 Tax=Nocardia sp. MH4 TaxID=1768677 RepID=UPI001C4EDF03|nr:hypothetical protein [Nocardia sp. MH4]
MGSTSTVADAQIDRAISLVRDRLSATKPFDLTIGSPPSSLKPCPACEPPIQ